MSTPVSRRGFFAGLLGAAAAGAAAPEAASTIPPRCRHYYDGVLWCQGDPSRARRYVRDEAGCPFCRAEEWANRRGVTPWPAGSRTTYVYDARPLPKLCSSCVTTTTYDANGRVLSVTGPTQRTTYSYTPRRT